MKEERQDKTGEDETRQEYKRREKINTREDEREERRERRGEREEREERR